MDDEAYQVLDAICRSASIDPDGHVRWINAFKTIRWVVQTDSGLAVTPEGRQARDEFAARLREGRATAGKRVPDPPPGSGETPAPPARKRSGRPA
ncbi:MAG TPA: hypothetical protein VHY34_05520 [Caulobacteraceae bacterium]|jgi:hypothetical protein|nr:hypothetical protein [Caulobacteraceae bacterium]